MFALNTDCCDLASNAQTQRLKQDTCHFTSFNWTKRKEKLSQIPKVRAIPYPSKTKNTKLKLKVNCWITPRLLDYYRVLDNWALNEGVIVCFNTSTFFPVVSPNFLSKTYWNLTEFFEQNILEPFMGNNLHPWVEDCEHVVRVLVPRVPEYHSLTEHPTLFTLNVKWCGINLSGQCDVINQRKLWIKRRRRPI